MEVTKKSWIQRIKERKNRLNKKAREYLSLDKNGQEILKNFESSLKNSFLTSSFFEEIARSNLNQKGCRTLMMAIMFLLLHAIPVYGIHSVLFYFKDVKWTLFQTVFPNFVDHIPLVIPFITHIVVYFLINVVVEKVFLWKFEVKRSRVFDRHAISHQISSILWTEKRGDK